MPLAEMDYVGVSGITQSCLDAVMRLLQFGDRIKRTRILSCERRHGLLLTVNEDSPVAVKAGFASGYQGEGPCKFSYVLHLLRTYAADIDEYEIDRSTIERLNTSRLTQVDINTINEAKPIRPVKWFDYILEDKRGGYDPGDPLRNFPLVIPLGIVDGRLADLAISFWDDPDAKLITGYRRLEDLVRQRTGLTEHGRSLFSQAFLHANAKLSWRSVDANESIGRAGLFIAAFMAHRNPRAHRVPTDQPSSQLQEFLLLNYLYVLEGEAINTRPNAESSGAGPDA